MASVSRTINYDELPEFPRSALEALREPLETGQITISRAGYQAQYPARFQLVAAMNPCPCGWLGAFASNGRQCVCSSEAVRRYQAKLSGPLLDRIDMRIEVPALRPTELLHTSDRRREGTSMHEPEASAQVAARVREARKIQMTRQGMPNSMLTAAQVEAEARLAQRPRTLLIEAADRLGWSGRALHRVVKVARTIADLAGGAEVAYEHIAEAVQYRRAIAAG